MLQVGKGAKALFAVAFALALCVALAGCGGSSSSSATSSASGSAASASASSEAASSSSASAASQEASSASASAASTSSSAAEASSASASSAASSSTSSQFAAETLDDHKNITLYAIMELTGPELTDLLQEQGYEWNSAKSAWLREVDGATFFALKETGQFTQADYQAATQKGGVAVAISCNIVGGWKDAQAALSGNAKCVIEDSYFDANGSGIAIVYGPSMTEYLVIAQPSSESTSELDIYSKEAVGSGMLDQVYGGQLGGSFQEVWKTFTGQDSYGH